MRSVDEIIVHCTATPEGRPVTVAEIDRWHRERGWSGIGYHRVIYLDGARHAGRPLEKIGAHVAGHNERTIGVVYVGGVAADGVTPKDTRTAAQKKALLEELVDLRDRFRIAKLSGHNEYAAKACPSFDASREYDAMFERGGPAKGTRDRVLQRGDIGPAVAQWRDDLGAYRERIGHPYPVPAGDVFDHTIELVTIWFQRERGIVADGKVGPQTRTEMARALRSLDPYQVLPENSAPDIGAAIDFQRKALQALGA